MKVTPARRLRLTDGIPQPATVAHRPARPSRPDWSAFARHRLTEIYDWFTEGFDTRDLVEARNLLEELRGA